MDEEMCKIPEIQSKVASVHGIYNVLDFMPGMLLLLNNESEGRKERRLTMSFCAALFLTGPYGRIAEVLGKRFILCLNLCSVTLAQLYFTGVCEYSNLRRALDEADQVCRLLPTSS